MLYLYRSDDHVIAEWRHDEFGKDDEQNHARSLLWFGYLALQRNYNIIIIKLKEYRKL